MVLRDVSILNMSFDQFTTVTRPKVLGSIFLDRIFDHQPLDFFIFFSSINCVVGNLGQANYAAANMFMCAMAANRRKRGLTGSVSEFLVGDFKPPSHVHRTSKVMGVVLLMR